MVERLYEFITNILQTQWVTKGITLVEIRQKYLFPSTLISLARLLYFQYGYQKETSLDCFSKFKIS